MSRRYSEEEMAAIFEEAARAQHAGRKQLRAPSEGMTIDELTEIGLEAGIQPELVAEAARALDRRGRSSTQRLVGLPIGVGHTVDLPRRLSDEEWEHLVVDLRETFDARGRLRVEGSLKQWTNGNLQALLEPTPQGHRLRLRTNNGNSRVFMTMGGAFMGFTAAMMTVALLSGEFAQAVASTGTIFLVGLGLFGVGALRLPGWARTRSRQMEEVARRLISRVEAEGRGS